MTLGAKKNKKRFEDLPPHQQKAGLKMLTCFGIVGWLMLIGYGIYAWNNARFLRESVEGTAEVIHIEEDRRYDSERGTSITYRPTFRFESADGQTYTVTPWYQTSDWSFSEGEQITIRYRPSEPEKAVPYGYMDQLFGVPILSLVMYGIGSVFAFVGTFGYIDLRRRMRRSGAAV